MKKTVLGLFLLASSVSFANSNVEKNKKFSGVKKSEVKTEKVSRCSVEVSPGNTLTLNCGTCSGSECLTRLKAILENQKPHIAGAE